MDKRKLAWAVAALIVVLAAGFAYSLTRTVEKSQAETKDELAEKQTERIREACASNATYARLKEVMFEEAIRIRNADPTNLDTLAANSVVRMEKPVVKSRDKDLNVTVCTGQFVLEVPPGAEVAFGGARRLVANIEYAAQAAADGSGLVYQMNGAEPIIYRLAAFDLQGNRYQAANAEPPVELAEAPAAPEPAPEPVREEAAAPEPAPPPPPSPAPRRPEPRPAPAPERRAPEPEPRPDPRPAPARASASSSPSFNCRYARSSSEKMVCSSDRLAAKDRAMSSLFYSALSDADGRTRAELRRTRDRFLAYRERCGSEACIAEAYDGRMREIRDIMADSE